jgi:decaprenylphospho-beta-D-erythro-pentofuranosid-2-ulose 2-reductase
VYKINGYFIFLTSGTPLPGNFMRVVIIGATSAVAQAVTKRIAESGAEIFCLARDEQKMEVVAETLGGAVKGVCCFDFTDSTLAREGIQRAVECLGGIDIALVAHGLLLDQVESEQDFALVKSTFEANCLSVIALLIPLCEEMKRQGGGKIGVITSVAGDRGRPRNFTYGAAKGGLSIYLQGLRSSLWGSGVEIYDFRLGPVDTPMTTSHEKNFSFSTVDTVADLIVKAFGRKNYCCYLPGWWRFVMLVVRNLPESLFQKLRFLSAR